MKRKPNIIIYFLLMINCVIFNGCNENDGSGQNDLNAELRQIIAANGLTGDPSLGRNIPDVNDPLTQLGMKLFFTKALSGNMDVACVTCHHPALGGGDNLSLPVGVDSLDPDLLGPGRMHASGSPNVPRNSPTIFNIAMWDHVVLWDGRIESLGKTPLVNGDDGVGIRTPDSAFGTLDPGAGDNLPMAQSHFPVISYDEMRGDSFEAGGSNEAVREHIAARIGDYGIGQFELTPNQWLAEFQNVFNSNEDAATLITYDKIAKAIAAYERSMVLVNSSWAAFVSGDDGAVTPSAKRGALLFFRSSDKGGAGCSHCHKGDFFTDEQFHVVATPQVGIGKGDGENGSDDFGCFRETGDESQKYAFRTPSLLNIEVTGPYGHSGPYANLEGIVRHLLDPEQAIENYDYSQLDPSINTSSTMENTRNALMKLMENQRAGISPLKKTVLEDTQVKDLVEFLKTLTDPCAVSRECLGKWIPDEDDMDPDGRRLSAIDVNGNPL